jgi:hypothetical protein
MADDMTAGIAGHPVQTDGVDACEVGLVKRHRHVESLGRTPQHVEVGMVDGAATDPVGPHHAADETMVGDGSLEFGRGQTRVLLRQQGHPDQTVRVGGAVAAQPVVVGRTQGGRDVGVLQQPEHQSDTRIQHRRVDPLVVEDLQPKLGIPAALAPDPACGHVVLKPAGEGILRPPESTFDAIGDVPTRFGDELHGAVAHRRGNGVDQFGKCLLDMPVGVDHK